MSAEDDPKKAKPGTGYKRPPFEHRFQKGQSGNPMGRPRQAAALAPKPHTTDTFQTELAALAHKTANRKATLRDGEKSESVSMIEAALRTEAVRAVQGKRLDKKDMLDRHAKAEAELLATRRRDYDDWTRIKAFLIEQRETIAECDLKHPLPYPDDIILGPDYKVSIVGPANADELARVEAICRHRDLMILQWVLDVHWRMKGKSGFDYSALVPLSTLFIIIFERQLPRRFQLGDAGIAKATDAHLGKSMRDIEDEVRAGRTAFRLTCGKRICAFPCATKAQVTKILRSVC
jgi:hypothetical protein